MPEQHQPTDPEKSSQPETKVELTQTELDARIEQARKQAFAEGLKLAFDTAVHYTGNRSALTLGYGELLAHDESLPEMQRQWAQLALEGAEGVGEANRKMQLLDPDHLIIEGRNHNLAYIDLDKSLEAKQQANLSGHTEPSSSPPPLKPDPSA